MYLVTGGCGFIGSHLVDFLVNAGYGVHVLDDLSNSSKKYLSPHAKFFFGSIQDESILKQALEGVEGVFHLAAKVSVPESVAHWHKTHQINCGASVLLFELAKTRPIVFASSAAVYGDCKELPLKEESLLRPLSPYAADKLSLEIHAKMAWHLYRIPSIACRFFNVYGPRQNPDSPYSGVISKFIDCILHNKAPIIYGDGQQKRDFIYVKDVVKMLARAMDTLKEGAHVYNFCSGNACSINALADLISKLTGQSIEKEKRPSRQGDIRNSQGDPTKAYVDLGLKAETPLEEGLKHFLADQTR